MVACKGIDWSWGKLNSAFLIFVMLFLKESLYNMSEHFKSKSMWVVISLDFSASPGLVSKHSVELGLEQDWERWECRRVQVRGQSSARSHDLTTPRDSYIDLTLNRWTVEPCRRSEKSDKGCRRELLRIITYNYDYKIHDFWYPPQYVQYVKFFKMSKDSGWSRCPSPVHWSRWRVVALAVHHPA